jgi:hypothetical protein
MTLMQEWAAHAPVNYQHKYNLVLAKQARVNGDRLPGLARLKPY